MSDHTLPPGVEAIVARATNYPRCSHYLDFSECRFAAETMGSIITAQAEEIERLEVKCAHCQHDEHAMLRAERDRYKAMAEWLAAGAWQNYCPEFPPHEIEGVGTVVGLVVEDEDCPLGIRADDPEHCPKCWLKAAEEATHD